MRKLYLTLVATVVALCATICGVIIPNVNAAQALPSNVVVQTLSDLGNASYAGTGSYYDDGMLKYANSGNTIGYQFDQSKTLVEFDIVFDNIVFPGWFSLTLKASGFDRTQAPALYQKGYSFVVYANGNVEVWKPGLSGVSGHIANFAQGVKYRFKLGAVNTGKNVQLYFSVDGNEIINVTDTNGAYVQGKWFNICGDGGTSARLFSTKKEIVPAYHTYTLSTLGDYPIATDNGVSYDKYKNVTLHSSAGTFGWSQGLKNYSVEMNMNWTRFGAGCNLWVAMRAPKFDRVNALTEGYFVRIGQVGVIEIYKNHTLITSGGWSYSQNTDFVFEFGCVDLDANRTMVFVNVNGKPAASMVDDNNPINKAGLFLINGDGDVVCEMTSVNTKLTPLVTKVSETATSYTVETYFNNTISYTNMNYADFSDVLLDAILINDNSVKDINKNYYALNQSEQVRAVEVSYVDNKLILNINKTRYFKLNDSETQFEFSELALKKTGATSGLICPSGFALKQTYYYTV